MLLRRELVIRSVCYPSILLISLNTATDMDDKELSSRSRTNIFQARATAPSIKSKLTGVP